MRPERHALAAAAALTLAACAEMSVDWEAAARDWLAQLCRQADRCDWRDDGAAFR